MTKPYCDCLTRHTGKAGWKQVPGLEWKCGCCGQTNYLFVCGLCNRPSRMVWESEGRLPGGVSILEMLWRDLDAVVDRIMAEESPKQDKGRSNQDRGRAEAFATAIAYFIQPYRPNVKEVKRDAMRRYHGRQMSSKKKEE